MDGRARPHHLASQGWRIPAIAAELGMNERTIRAWLTRFNAAGLAGLRDAPRAGCPPTYSREQVGEVVATALTNPRRLDLPFASCTLDRLTA